MPFIDRDERLLAGGQRFDRMLSSLIGGAVDRIEADGLEFLGQVFGPPYTRRGEGRVAG